MKSALSVPIGLVIVHVYIPLSLVVTLSMVYLALNTALVLVCVTAVILVDCIIGPLSFLQVNVSGGEPREIQDNVRVEPTKTVMLDDDGVSITGAAVWRDESC